MLAVSEGEFLGAVLAAGGALVGGLGLVARAYQALVVRLLDDAAADREADVRLATALDRLTDRLHAREEGDK